MPYELFELLFLEKRLHDQFDHPILGLDIMNHYVRPAQNVRLYIIKGANKHCKNKIFFSAFSEPLKHVQGFKP